MYVAGGEASLPESITAQVAEAIPDDSTVEQVAGAERQSTSVAFAELGQEEFGFVADHANIASARDQNLTDALAFGPHAGLDFTGPAPILVNYPETLSESATAFLGGQDTCFAALHLAGGTEALSDDVEQQAREAASTDCDDDGVPSGLFGVTAGPVTEVVQFGDDGSETRTPIVNVPAGLEVVGADVRSSTGLVYVLTDDGSVHIVTIDEPGVAATVATVGNVNDDPQPGTPAGTATAPFDLTSGVGFDFNPSGPNALRIVTADGVNLRVAFDADGAVATTFVDGDLAYSDGTAGDPAVTGAAYTDNAALGETATATSLYDLDTAAGTLVTQAPANDGTLQTVGDLGVAASEVNGFDIVSEAGDADVDGNAAYAALTVDGAQALYEVDLETGATTPVAGGDFDETFIAVGFLPQTTTR